MPGPNSFSLSNSLMIMESVSGTGLSPRSQKFPLSRPRAWSNICLAICTVFLNFLCFGYDQEGRFVPQNFENIFSKYDQDGDGILTLAELFSMVRGHRCAVDPFGVSCAGKP